MKTFSQMATGPGGFTDLSANSSSDNVLRAKTLINDQHRYLIQRYFDNERTVTFQTIGGQSLTLTGTLAIGATSATLTAVWSYPTYRQYITTSNGEQRYALFTHNSATITWSDPLLETGTTAITSLGVQFYNIPANVSKIKNDTINVGQLKYQPRFIRTRQEWDDVNFLPYTSDIPQYCFIYNGQMGIWPIPSSTGNIVTFNFKARVPDLSFTDYTVGALATGGVSVGSTSITGVGTSWGSGAGYPIGVDISFYNLYLRINPPYGDGIWYPITSVDSDTSLTLGLPIINAPNIITGTTYTIGQLPLLSEDFQDMPIYGSLKIYFSSIVPDVNKFKQYEDEYQKRIDMLEEYAGTKNVNVDLGDSPNPVNPNLFIYKT